MRGALRLYGVGKTRIRQKVQLLRVDKIVCSDEKDVQIRRQRAQRSELQSASESLPKARLEPKHGGFPDKLTKSTTVAAGATVGAGVWEPHFAPSTVKMASPEYHGLLAHDHIRRQRRLAWISSCKRTRGRGAQPQLGFNTKLAQWCSELASRSDSVHVRIPCKLSRCPLP